MRTPAFSIVTAIKDGLRLFRETAPTILGQTDEDWEWILVDDSSEEPVGDYVRGLNDPRIRFFRNSAPQGQTRSLNLGIRESRADWIVRMDADDLAERRRLEATRGEIERPGRRFAPVIFSDYKIVGEDGRHLTTVRYREPLRSGFYSYLERNNPLCHPGVTFYKYSPLGTVYQFDESLRNAQDYELWKRIQADYGRSFTHLAEPLISYRLVRRSLSGAEAPEQKEELRAIRESGAGRTRDAPGAPSLGEGEREGMYAYRILYYRFVGDGPGGAVPGLADLRLFARALRYAPVALKSALFLALRPFKAPLKRLLFHGIYR